MRDPNQPRKRKRPKYFMVRLRVVYCNGSPTASALNVHPRYPDNVALLVGNRHTELKLAGEGIDCQEYIVPEVGSREPVRINGKPSETIHFGC